MKWRLPQLRKKQLLSEQWEIPWSDGESDSANVSQGGNHLLTAAVVSLAAPATTTEEEKSVNRVTTPLLSHHCSSHYPPSQATGPGLRVSLWHTHKNSGSPQQAEQMTTHTCVAQYAIAQKAKEKAFNPKLLSPFFGERRQGWRSAGIFGNFFYRLTPTQHARSLSEAARPPACIVAGSFGARQGGLQGRPSAQHVPASLFGNRRTGPARWSGGGRSQAQLTDTTHPLSHSQSLSRRRLPRSTSAFPSRLSPPCFAPHVLPSSLQGSEITL